MNLFINAVSKKGVFIIFDENKNIKISKKINVIGNESSLLINELDDFIKSSNFKYKDFENIVVISGPGSFTAIRTITLLANTINFITKKGLTSLNFFDLFEKYPIIKSSSKRDLFFKKDENSSIEIISNLEAIEYIKLNDIKSINGDVPKYIISEVDRNIVINDIIDYNKIIKNLKFDSKNIIEPIYLKKPNIS